MTGYPRSVAEIGGSDHLRTLRGLVVLASLNRFARAAQAQQAHHRNQRHQADGAQGRNRRGGCDGGHHHIVGSDRYLCRIALHRVGILRGGGGHCNSRDHIGSARRRIGHGRDRASGLGGVGRNDQRRDTAGRVAWVDSRQAQVDGGIGCGSVAYRDGAGGDLAGNREQLARGASDADAGWKERCNGELESGKIGRAHV